MMEDFQVALSEIRPAFGAMADTLESYRLNGIINYGPDFDLLSSSQSIVQQACPPPCNRPLSLQVPPCWHHIGIPSFDLYTAPYSMSVFLL